MVLFGLFLVIIFTLGHLLLGQMWTQQALENSTQAGEVQLNTSLGINSPGVEMQNQADAINAANKTWQLNQSLNPYVSQASASFSTDGSTVTGTASMPVNQSLANNFLDSLGQKDNFGGTLVETVKSSLPPAPTTSLPSPPSSSLPTDTLPKLGTSQ